MWMARNNGPYGGHSRRNGSRRTGETFSLSQFAASQRARIYDGVSPERRQQFEAAERRAQIMRAWNEVCANTREGKHVTGLYYVPEADELVVYTDGSTWTQELTMMREIIRARMERAGAHVDGLVFKTTAPGHTPPAAKERLRPAPTERPPAPHADLSEAERTEIERQVAPIEDQKLREALENAMRASAEWAKGVRSKKEP